jgi:hypothetical protein
MAANFGCIVVNIRIDFREMHHWILGYAHIIVLSGELTLELLDWLYRLNNYHNSHSSGWLGSLDYSCLGADGCIDLSCFEESLCSS